MTGIDTYSYDDAAKVAQKREGGGGDLLTLEDGETVELAVLSPKPAGWQQVWVDGHSEIFDPMRHSGARVSRKFGVYVAIWIPPMPGATAGTFVARIWIMAAATFNDLNELITGDWPIERATYKVKRTGTGRQTRYPVMPAKELTPAQLEELSELRMSLQPLDYAIEQLFDSFKSSGEDGANGDDFSYGANKR